MIEPDTTVASDVDFCITRTFNAPRALVFATMIETEHLQHWWGPHVHPLPGDPSLASPVSLR